MICLLIILLCLHSITRQPNLTVSWISYFIYDTTIQNKNRSECVYKFFPLSLLQELYLLWNSEEEWDARFELNFFKRIFLHHVYILTIMLACVIAWLMLYLFAQLVILYKHSLFTIYTCAHDTCKILLHTTYYIHICIYNNTYLFQ